jgi:hypothetical protein
MKYIFLSLLMTGCSITLRQDQPAVVEHRINLDDVEEYFYRACEAELPDGISPDIEKCVDTYMAKFIETLGDAL